MLKFENTTTKESFEKSVKWSKNKIEETIRKSKIVENFRLFRKHLECAIYWQC